MSEGRVSDTMRMGQSVRILVDVAGYRDVPSHVFAVSLQSAMGQKLLQASTSMKPGRLPSDREAMERIVIEMESLTLLPGHYTLNVGVWGRGFGCFDLVEQAAAFTVVPSDVLGSGYAFEPGEGRGQGLVFANFDWEVQPRSATDTYVGTDVPVGIDVILGD